SLRGPGGVVGDHWPPPGHNDPIPQFGSHLADTMSRCLFTDKESNMKTPTHTSIYDDLGLKPVINALGNWTMLGGSSPSPRLLAALAAAGRYYVDMEELLDKSGRLSAGLVGAEAAYVTPGAAAALALGAAACMTGGDL